MSKIGAVSICSLVLLIGLVTYLAVQERLSRGPRSNESIFFFCAAGVKPPVEAAARDYEREYGVDITLQYGGSGTLLNNVRITQKGDIYLAADNSYIALAKEQGLVIESIPLADLRPVVAVRNDSSLDIRSLEDLLDKRIRLAVANPDAASIGRLTRKIFQEAGYGARLEERAAVFKPTVTDVANDIKVGSIDAGIIWDATANQYPEIRAIHLPRFEKYVETVTAGILTCSESPTAALTFLRYLGAGDRGLLRFAEVGYNPVDGDPWEERPSILLYSGGVNRLAIEQTIQRFEKREGVTVTRVYNGCGILVSQMHAGGRPDAYFACDVSFMDDVSNLFEQSVIISQTPMVMLVRKGNPSDIRSLEDLTRPGLKLGLANHEQSALGALTQRLLQEMGLWEAVMKNVRSQTPTADLLVNQIRTGSLDAVIVYEANTSQVRETLEIIPINHPKAQAIQPFAVSRTTRHKVLTERLLAAIASVESREAFESTGFTWRVEE